MIKTETKIACSHCGETCMNQELQQDDLNFCCLGCKQVYAILHQHKMTDYYCLNPMPGNKIISSASNKFDYLEDESIASKLISFKNAQHTQVQFFIPQMHCSSCLWLLEHLYKLHEGILQTDVNFTDKSIRISFQQDRISLKELCNLLMSLGYEPHITLKDYEEEKTKPKPVSKYLKLGLVGFCFGNIMLISFPEYLGLDLADNPLLLNVLRFTNLGISLPVFFYGASEFFKNAWQSIKQKHINIDAPISLAIVLTFTRSVFEILTHTGAGYLDSMCGIVFFMLIGRGLQRKTLTHLKFNRDYTSYFPIALTVVKDKEMQVKKIQEVEEGDVLKINSQEIIPVDCILSSRLADIDYSFVTGENDCTSMHAGELIYAGGKVMHSSIEVIAIKPFSQSHFTSLWNNQAFKKEEEYKSNFVELISKYFSLALILIASLTFVYWQIVNPANAWNALTAVLIIACPCTLLLTSSYTFGYLMEWFSKEGLFIKNADTITKMTQLDHIVFDKTGTISEVVQPEIIFMPLNSTIEDLRVVVSIMKQSNHPFSKIIAKHYEKLSIEEIQSVKEIAGQGIEAWHNEQHIKIGSASFVGMQVPNEISGSLVCFSVDGKTQAYFILKNKIRSGIKELFSALKKYSVSLLSGDNALSVQQMKHIFPKDSSLLFQQTPQQKLDYIHSLQMQGKKVMMIGDGINDAGALKQSDLGISVVENHFSFSPASDAIIHADRVANLHAFIQSAIGAKRLIIGSFIYSLFYNAIGIYFAVSAQLKPVIAAILMPASSISVILIAFVGTRYLHYTYFQKNNEKQRHDKNHVLR